MTNRSICGSEMHGGGAANADDERADQRALDRAHAADRDHREGEHDHFDADAERHRNLRRHDRAAERAEHGADDEGDGVDELDTLMPKAAAVSRSKMTTVSRRP